MRTRRRLDGGLPVGRGVMSATGAGRVRSAKADFDFRCADPRRQVRRRYIATASGAKTTKMPSAHSSDRSHRAGVADRRRRSAAPRSAVGQAA